MTEVNSSASVKRYRLRLGNGQEWQIIGANRTRGLAEKLASIMQLKAREAEGAPRLILKQWEAADRAEWAPAGGLATSIAADLPTRGWRAYYPFSPSPPGYLPSFRVLLHDEVRDAIFEIGEGPEFGDDTTPLHRRTTQILQTLAESNLLREVISTIYQQTQDSGGLPLHSAIAARNGMAVLLVGNSGAGKSTCCRRLPPSWQRMGDEEALIVRNDRGRYIGHAFPTWSNLKRGRGEQSWRVEHGVPLAAIFILQQAEIDEVAPVGEGEAALFLTDSATKMWDPCREGCPNPSGDGKWPPRRSLFENACAIARSVPAFILRASRTGRFWEEIERTLSRLPAEADADEAAAVS
jgi:hypothetical protein